MCFVIPHSNAKKYECTANKQRANNDVMDSNNNDVSIIGIGSR